jgi:hypothetical protein
MKSCVICSLHHCNYYYYPVKEDEVGGACGMNWNMYRILVRKPEGKRPLRRPRHRWADSYKIDLVEVGSLFIPST